MSAVHFVVTAAKTVNNARLPTYAIGYWSRSRLAHRYESAVAVQPRLQMHL